MFTSASRGTAHVLLRVAFLAVVGAAILFAPMRASGDEDGDPTLVTALIDVGALTAGAVDFIPGILGVVDPDWVSDGVTPLFGTEGEEPGLPYGTVDELLEILKSTVEPEFWEVTEGADILPYGEGTLVVHATSAVLQRMQERLAGLERDALGTIRLDVVAVTDPSGRLATGSPLAEEAFRAALERGEIRRVLSFAVEEAQKGVAHAGGERAFVQDYDVEIDKASAATDPIVGIARHGLEVEVRGEPSDDGRLVLAVRIQHVTPLAGTQQRMPDGNRLELPRYEEASARFERTIEAGRWYAAAGVARGDPSTALLYRARLVPARVAVVPVDVLPAWPAPDTAAMETRFLDVRDLNGAPRNMVARSVHLEPSNYLPPEPPELNDPMPLLPVDALVELLLNVAPPRTWSRTGAMLDARGGRLIVRQTPAVIGAIEAQLRHLRRQYLDTLSVSLELIDVPTAMAMQLTDASGGNVGMALPTKARDGIARALDAGEAQAVASVRLDAFPGSQKVVEQGTHRQYVQDWALEVAEGASVAKPVTKQFFEGVVATVRPVLTLDRRSAKLALRFAATRLESLTQSPTEHGPIDTPALSVLEWKGDVLVPLDQTALVFAGGDGERTRVLLVTPTLQGR